MIEDEEVPKSEDGTIPAWLIAVYMTLVIGGVIWFYLNFDGPWKYMDPGAWRRLEKAANTTFAK